MRLNRCRFVLAFFIIGVATCSDFTGPRVEQTRLEANRNRWSAQKLARYQFTLIQTCFCAINGPVRVSVIDGSVVGATRIATGEEVDTRYMSTIESLFDFIEHAIARRAAVLVVTYDPVLGYPRQIVYDGAVNAADDEVTYEAGDLVPLAIGDSK